MKHLNSLNRKRLLLIVVPVLLMGIYYGYNRFDAWRTSQKFASLEQDINTLKSELEKQGIQEISKNKYCLRDGEKFGGGQLRCEIDISASYVDESKNKEKTQLVQNQIIRAGFKEVVPLNLDNPNSTAQYSAKSNSNCYLSVTREPDGPGFIFYCIDAVNNPIYPINE